MPGNHLPSRIMALQLECPICKEPLDGNAGTHLRQVHGEDALREAVLTAKKRGMPDSEIGSSFGISFNTLQEIITKTYGTNISVLAKKKRIKRWSPPNCDEETTTVWSFRQRGAWATHDGRYRGNWSPYIPRNVILKYSQPGDIVLDYFSGGGTTAVEAKLLGRRCIARDINPGAVGLTLENLDFSLPRELFGDRSLPIYEPQVSVGDARDLADIPDGSIDLICAHPPYAGIIKYGANIPGDLSDLSVQEFLAEMTKVAAESLRVLKPGGKCVILIGDARKSKCVVPIGYQTIRTFLNAGFILRDLVLKRQHNCKTTGFWYTRSIQHNFLLLAHEYLPIFEKPLRKPIDHKPPQWADIQPLQLNSDNPPAIDAKDMESTTVWVFPQETIDTESNRNLVQRFARPDAVSARFHFKEAQQLSFPGDRESPAAIMDGASLDRSLSAEAVADYRITMQKIADQVSQMLPAQGSFVIDTHDFRVGATLWPMGLLLWEEMALRSDFSVKEIVILVPADYPAKDPGECLEIVHRYLLVFSKA